MYTYSSKEKTSDVVWDLESSGPKLPMASVEKKFDSSSTILLTISSRVENLSLEQLLFRPYLSLVLPSKPVLPLTLCPSLRNGDTGCCKLCWLPSAMGGLVTPGLLSAMFCIRWWKADEVTPWEYVEAIAQPEVLGVGVEKCEKSPQPG